MFPQRTAIQFVCEPCHFKCSKNCDYQRHLITAKHLRLSNATKMLQYDNKTLVDVPKKFNCDCGKIYTHSSSYYRHKKNVFQILMTLIKNYLNTIKTMKKKHLIILSYKMFILMIIYFFTTHFYILNACNIPFSLISYIY